MADFTPKKASTEKGKAVGSLASGSDVEHQDPPTIYLGHHHLAKLGMDKMPPVGSKIKISGLAHVGSTSERDEAMRPGEKGGGKQRSMTLHLHKLEMGADGAGDASDESQKEGMKSEIDKALTKHAGSESKKGQKEGKAPAVRAGGD
jgi:hypothetical protein